jgi:hypothetical protein
MKNILVDRIELNQSLDACIQGVVGPARDYFTDDEWDELLDEATHLIARWIDNKLIMGLDKS